MLSVSLKKTYKGIKIRTDFSIVGSEIIALYGRSGTGKSTIINMLAGLVEPDYGEIKLSNAWVYNSRLGINHEPEKRKFGYVFQDGRLFPHLTVEANLNFGHKLLKKSQRKVSFDEVVSLLKLKHLLKRRPSKLSGGEKQRVAIGRALLMSPSVLLMDEPLASLDSYTKREILPFISLVSRELTIPVVYVSHSRGEIEFLTNNVLEIAGHSLCNHFLLNSARPQVDTFSPAFNQSLLSA